MKTYRLAILLYLVPILVFGQNESTEVLKVEESPENKNIAMAGTPCSMNHYSDTIIRITIGRKKYEIVDVGYHNPKNNKIRMVHAPTDRFKGHWNGVDIGFTNFFS